MSRFDHSLAGRRACRQVPRPRLARPQRCWRVPAPAPWTPLHYLSLEHSAPHTFSDREPFLYIRVPGEPRPTHRRESSLRLRRRKARGPLAPLPWPCALGAPRNSQKSFLETQGRNPNQLTCMSTSPKPVFKEKKDAELGYRQLPG